MTQLNHINLAVSNVPELSRFFQSAFQYRVQRDHPSGHFAVLTSEDGFVLVLMHDKNVTEKTYPASFHVGFLVNSEEEVHHRYALIQQAGFDVPQPDTLERGGPKSFGFYCHAPGGVTVEVSTMQTSA